MAALSTILPIENWDEQTVQYPPGGGCIKRAEVTLGAGPDGLGPGTSRSLLHYAEDGTSTYVSLLTVEGTFDGRSGSVVLVGEGSYDGTTASVRLRLLDRTDQLAGMTGSAISDSTAADYPHLPLSLEYAST